MQATDSGEERMKHFTAQEWVDFVRDAVREDQKALMQAHLNSGCQRCQREAKTWLRVRETATRQRASEPDDSAVRFVKASFALSRECRAKHSSRSFAEVLFDSSLDPLPVGVRSAATSSRQLLFGAEDLRIDLRLEPKIDSENVSLIGQILDSADPTKSRMTASVALLKAGRVVSEANTNRFGEFQLECGLAARMELRVTLPNGKEAYISLVDPTDRAEKDPSEVIDSKVVTGLPRTSKRTRKLV
jgi:hypothetical protein